MKVRIIRKGKSIAEIITHAKRIPAKIQAEANKIGIETLQVMKNKVNPRRQGSTGKLENSITLDYFPDGWGVGNISHMDSVAPYWKFIDKGGFVPGGGQWRPVGFTDGRADPNKRRTGTAKAMKFAPINQVGGMPPAVVLPKNFVSKTQHFFENRITQFMAQLKAMRV